MPQRGSGALEGQPGERGWWGRGVRGAQEPKPLRGVRLSLFIGQKGVNVEPGSVLWHCSLRLAERIGLGSPVQGGVLCADAVALM